MNEAGHSAESSDSEITDGNLDSPLDSSFDFNTLIASLRAAGAEQFDSVRLHYIVVLAKRAMAQQGSAKVMLDVKVTQALAEFKERFEQAQNDARKSIARITPQYPNAANELQQLFASGNFKGLKRFIATLETSEQRSSLAALVRQLEHQSPANSAMQFKDHAEARPELKTIRNFRNTWSKLSTDKQVTQALEQAPKNAGPINSHMLVLRSLELMRDISPDYLNRFMSYADTLLILDQCEKEKLVPVKKPGAARAAKK